VSGERLPLKLLAPYPAEGVCMRDLCRDLLVVLRSVPFPRPRNRPAKPRRPAVEGLEGRVLLAATVYEAESAALTGASVGRSPGGFTGAGYVDYRNN
jgi:hypothetical protein